MLSRIFMQLFSPIALFSVSLQVASTEPVNENNKQIGEQANSNLQVIIDPETGQIVTDQNRLIDLKKSSSTSASIALEQTEVTMTKLENGATRIDFNGRFIRPLTVSVDEDGQLTSHGHTELDEEAK